MGDAAPRRGRALIMGLYPLQEFLDRQAGLPGHRVGDAPARCGEGGEPEAVGIAGRRKGLVGLGEDLTDPGGVGMPVQSGLLSLLQRPRGEAEEADAELSQDPAGQLASRGLVIHLRTDDRDIVGRGGPPFGLFNEGKGEAAFDL